MKITTIIGFFLFIQLSSLTLAGNMTKTEFQEYALTFLKSTYAEKTFKPSEDPELIETNNLQLGLQNLYAKYELEGLNDNQMTEVLKTHFDRVFSQIEKTIQHETLPWKEAKEVIRPMFAPLEYAKEIKVFHKKLDNYIVSTYVIDSEKGYKYVVDDDLKSWGVTEQEVQEAAQNNLSEVSKNVPLQGSLEKVKFLTLQTNDGYDAARLLLPDFREFIGSKLGFPFYAGVPNRDFLIMWSIENSEEVNTNFSMNIKSDFEERPYSLTPNVLLVEKNGIKQR